MSLTWTCHICGIERDDADIGVHQTDISELRGFAKGTILHNVRYCLDNERCVRAAQSYSHFARPERCEIFVFGSNLAGRHGKGAALAAACEHGAIYGVGEGRQGNSYAIPTKDRMLRPLELAAIRVYVERFLAYAREHPELRFRLTAVGCGLAGYTPFWIAPMFAGAPPNCALPHEFTEVLRKGK